MTTLKDKLKEFADYVELVTGRPTVLMHANGPQLTSPFMTVHVVFRPLPHDTKTTSVNVDGEMVETVRGLCIGVFEVTGWGGEPEDDLNRLRNSFWSSIFQDKLATKGFGLGEIGEVQDTSAPLISALFESRARLECNFYLSVPSSFIVDYFDHFNLEVQNPDRDYSVTVLIPPDYVPPPPPEPEPEPIP